MKLAIFIFIILVSNLLYASDNIADAGCNIVYFETNESSQTGTNDCCSVLCLCSCCNHLNVVSLIIFQNIDVNFSTPIFYSSIQNISEYSSNHWQPPKIL